MKVPEVGKVYVALGQNNRAFQPGELCTVVSVKDQIYDGSQMLEVEFICEGVLRRQIYWEVSGNTSTWDAVWKDFE